MKLSPKQIQEVESARDNFSLALGHSEDKYTFQHISTNIRTLSLAADDDVGYLRDYALQCKKLAEKKAIEEEVAPTADISRPFTNLYIAAEMVRLTIDESYTKDAAHTHATEDLAACARATQDITETSPAPSLEAVDVVALKENFLAALGEPADEQLKQFKEQISKIDPTSVYELTNLERLARISRECKQYTHGRAIENTPQQDGHDNFTAIYLAAESARLAVEENCPEDQRHNRAQISLGLLTLEREAASREQEGGSVFGENPRGPNNTPVTSSRSFTNLNGYSKDEVTVAAQILLRDKASTFLKNLNDVMSDSLIPVTRVQDTHIRQAAMRAGFPRTAHAATQQITDAIKAERQRYTIAL